MLLWHISTPLKLGMRRNQHPGGSKCEKSFFTQVFFLEVWGNHTVSQHVRCTEYWSNNHWNAINRAFFKSSGKCAKASGLTLEKINQPGASSGDSLSQQQMMARDYGASMACSRKSWCSNRTDALARRANKYLLLHPLIFSIPVPLFASTILKCPYSCGKLRQAHKMPMLLHAHPLRPAWSFDLFEAPVKRISIRSLQVKLWVEILINQ